MRGLYKLPESIFVLAVPFTHSLMFSVGPSNLSLVTLSSIGSSKPIAFFYPFCQQSS